ncbi:hypothetical protein [Streptomyces sp. SP17KL33]|uniref:hypothetical protein n=1 Tax=Streptomyces sp. SP17KL33 TaxID=3002534 RepID=UPI002E760520|nr:hypothetical protein [Streptomyces sp. SP17KL33]MEE1837450.1 hypothetical protein [Streptomyces sp. SP17KL33]
MAITDAELDRIKKELERLQENCLYSAQGYFEAAKSSELWGRLMVFIPACVTATAGFFTAVGGGRSFGAFSAVGGAVAATASFLGSSKKSTDFLASAHSYTALRNKLHLEINLLSSESDYSAMEVKVREFNTEYVRISTTDVPMPNRFFEKARARIRGNLVE